MLMMMLMMLMLMATPAPAPVPRLGAVAAAVLGADGRVQVDEEGEDIEAEDQRDDPLQHGGRVVAAVPGQDDERDRQHDRHRDEGELDPEGHAQDAVLAVADAQALVLPADEDGGQQVADDEEAEEDVVQARVAVGVEDGEEDEARRAHEGPGDGQAREDLLARGGVGDQAAAVAQPAVRQEGGVEEDGGQDAAGYEERLELARADV